MCKIKLKDSFSLQGDKVHTAVQRDINNNYVAVRYSKIERGLVNIYQSYSRDEVDKLLNVPPHDRKLFHPEDYNYIVVFVAEGIVQP